jgi:uncharacterized protein YecE (DUF72 family)
MNLGLFDSAVPEARSPLAEKLRALAAEGVYFGTSSWKYEGWLGSIYTPERYAVRGRFSPKRFEAECLAEYAETFPAVCGDFTFYQFPAQETWRRLFATAPPSLQFGFKAPEEITVAEWPTHARYGARGGRENESFLDADLLARAFLAPLEPYRDRVGVIILEFGAFPRARYATGAEFGRDLAPFLARLPRGWRYAVEVRNAAFFEPAYFDVLRAHGAAHVFNAWTRTPPLEAQALLEEAYTADFLVARALLRQGRSYAEAVKRFEPYREVQEPNPGARAGLKTLIERARSKRQLAFVFVNNRLEGNAPSTIQAVADSL